METQVQVRSAQLPGTALAIVLEGVSEQWQMNVVPIRGCSTRVQVTLEGLGTVDAPAIYLTQNQARDLATRIIEILGHEKR